MRKSIISRNLLYSFCLLFIFISAQAFAQKGEIKGIVKDKKTNETVIGANVVIQGTQIGSVTGLNGEFSIKNLNPGKYNIVVTFISYKAITLKDIKVSGDKPTIIPDILIEEEATALQGVVIKERRVTGTEVSMISSIRQSNLVVNAISSQQISRSQDKDASEVIRRVPGVTIVDDRFVMVRGLVERYNTVLLNNTTAPSSESDVKAFSFDVIPSSLLDRILVFKTPAPELQADFSGAAIQIFTKNMPDKNAVTFGYSTTFVDGTSFNDFYRYKGGKTDFLGFDDGGRSLPSGIPSTKEMLYSLQDFSDGKPQAEIDANKGRLTAIAQSFSNTSTAQQMTAPLNGKLNIDFSRRFKAGKWDIGTITALSYGTSYKTDLIHRAAFETYDTIADKSIYVYDYSDRQYSQAVSIGGLHSWSFLVGNSSFEFRNLISQVGRTRTTYRDGVDYYRSGNLVKISELEYMDRFTYTGQLSGTHKFNADKSLFNWTAGYAVAHKNEPDMRRFYTYSTMYMDDNGDTAYTPYAYDYGATVNTESNGRLYFDTHERLFVFNANYESKLKIGNFMPEIKAGFFYERKDREFSIRSFGIARAVPNAQFNQHLLYQPVDSAYTDANFNFTNGLKIFEDTRPEYSYHAGNNLIAAYFGIKIPITSLANLYTGVRFEKNTQSLDGFQAETDTITPDIRKDTLNYFPSANFTYNISDNKLLRLAYGLTVNRPEFREIAPYAFYDFQLSATIYGNSALKNAYTHNLDLRYEWYPSASDMITVGAFYKEFVNPIEMNFYPASNGWDFVFVNSKSAQALGVEFDMRKSFSRLSTHTGFLRNLKDFTVIFNASYIASELRSDAEYIRDKKRPMQGQSPYIINTGIFYQNDKIGFSSSLLYNIIGKRITIVGTPERPHIYEMPRNLLDFTFVQKIGKHFQIKGGVKDILAEKVVFQQSERYTKAGSPTEERIQVIRSFTPGRSISLGLNYTL